MDDEGLRKAILARFPEDALLEVRLERHEDRPTHVEPGEVSVTLVPRGPEQHNAEYRKAPEAVGHRVVMAFQRAHDATVQQLRKDLPAMVAERVSGLRIHYGHEAFGWNVGDLPPSERELTPVMARLGKTDLETLDTLIAAGVATSRAESVRWCLARVRERPGYARLQQAVKDIKQVVAKF